MIFEGTQICEKCNKPFPWRHNEDRKKEKRVKDDLPPVIVLSDEYSYLEPYYSKRSNSGKKIHFQMNCPQCNYDNWFDYEINED